MDRINELARMAWANVIKAEQTWRWPFWLVVAAFGAAIIFMVLS